jgi:predicted amidophosphoribosyltransferase
VGLLDLVVPVRCVACGAGELLLCDGCRAALLPVRAPLCARCGAPTAWPVERCGECSGRRLAFAQARAAVVYSGAARALVAGWKERGLRRLAVEAADAVEQAVARPEAEALTFVPGDADRVRWRGPNTAEALARLLGVRWELPVRPLLLRTGRVGPQRGLTRAGRRANVRGAFRPAGAVPTRIALVDDVYTTGATANVAASALRKGGARRVEVVTFARTARG